MSGRWKAFLISCTCVLVIGLALIGIGLALGGGGFINNASNGGLTFDRIKDDFFRHSSFQFNIGRNNDENVNLDNIALGASFDTFDNIQSLKVDTGYIQVVIREWDGNEVIVDTSNLSDRAKGRLSVNEIDNALKITQKQYRQRRIWGFRSSNISNEILIIQIPENYEFDNISLITGAGQIDAETIVAKNAYLEIGAGKIGIDKLISEEAHIRVGAGRFNVLGALVERVYINCGVGEVYFQIIGSEDEFDYSIEVGIGEVVFGTKTHAGLGNRVTSNQGLDKFIDVNVGIGSVTIDFRR